MRKDVPPQKISKLHLFPASHSLSSSPHDIIKISKDGEYVWVARGCTLEVFTCPHMCRVNYWGFPLLHKNPDVYILALEEFPSGGGPGGYRLSPAPHLLLAISGVNLLCLFDICNARVLKCIQMQVPISSLEVIASQGGACLQTRPLCPSLRLFFGVVAVGTHVGHLHLVDLCLDEAQGSDETSPAELLKISHQSTEFPNLRELALENNQHLCVTLSETDHDSLLYKGPHNKTLGVIISEDASVTSLLYVPNATLLVVGFKFGSFQLWNLQDISVLYASALSVDSSPVVQFSFQEPENDPRNYCYLWVVSGPISPLLDDDAPPTTASLYSLSFERKDWHDGFGSLYQVFNHCYLRFEHPLTVDPFNLSNDTEKSRSRIVKFGLIQEHHINNNLTHDIEDPQADEWNIQDLSMCLIVWEAWEPHEPPCYYMALFDINQWYQAQMPSTVRKPGLCSFLGVFSLIEVMEKHIATSSNFILQDVHVPLDSLRRFRSLSPVDEMYYPSSYAFKAICLTEYGVTEVSYLGTQRQLLWELQNLGPMYLREPTEIFLHCCRSGLITYAEGIPLNQKREALLSLALEYDLLSYLKDCVLQFPTVDHSSGGFSLRFLTDWAWKKISVIRSAVDRLYVPMFNCSGQELDSSSLALLYNYSSQLQALTCLYQIMQFQASQGITQAGFEELAIQEEVTDLWSVYLQVILWLYQYCCLLPEHAEGESYGENEVAYPTLFLTQAYSQRRQDLHKLHSSVGPTDLLLIDGLMSKLSDLVPLHWERGSNYESNGSSRLYPPPSLFAFLNIYLVRGVPMMDKHCLTLYLLLDMADFLSHKQSHLEERLMQFPAAFKMSPSIVKIVQGFWMLDRKDFAKATAFLTHPIVRSWDLDNSFHTRVLKSLLYQGQEKLALTYMNIRKPLLDSPEDIKLHLSLLLANRLILEAYNFQRRRSDEDLLNHFFLGCQQTGNMCDLLELPLAGSEEQVLMKFLVESCSPTAKDMLILYLLQRHRPLEALEFTDKLNRKGGSLCSSLVNQFISILPSAQVSLAKELAKPFSRGNLASGTSSENKGSAPLSSLSINKSALSGVISQSSHLQGVKEALYNVWNKKSTEPQSPFRTRTTAPEPWTRNSMPFVGTPSRKQRKSESELVYATPVGKRSSSMLVDNTETPRFPNKKSRGMDIISPMKRINSDRRENRALNSEAVLLLQTPPIKRQVAELRMHAPRSAQQPQQRPASILKPAQSTTTTTTQRNDVEVVHSRLKYFDGHSGDMSETDMELAECASTSVSEDDIYEESVSLKPRNTQNTSQTDVNRRLSGASSTNTTNESLSFHKSDEIIVEDEDITLNYSIHKRRDFTRSLGRSFLHKARDLNKRCEENSSTGGRTPPSHEPSPSTNFNTSPRLESSFNTQGHISGHDKEGFSASPSRYENNVRSASPSLVVLSDEEPLGVRPHTSPQVLEKSTVSGSPSFAALSCEEQVNLSSISPPGHEQHRNFNASPSVVMLPDEGGIRLQDSSIRETDPPDVDTFVEWNQNLAYEGDVIAQEAVPVESFLMSESLHHVSPYSDNNVKLAADLGEQQHVIIYEEPLTAPCTPETQACVLSEALSSTVQHVPTISSLTSVNTDTVNDERDRSSHLVLSSDEESNPKTRLENRPSEFYESSLIAETPEIEVYSALTTDIYIPERNGSAESTFTLDKHHVGDELSETRPFTVDEQEQVINLEETGCFDVFQLDHSKLNETMQFAVSSLTSPSAEEEEERASFPNENKSLSDSVLFIKTVRNTAKVTDMPSPKKPLAKTRSTRRKARESIVPAHFLPPLLEHSSPSSSEQSPSSSVFVTPEKASPVSQWNTRLRPRSDSRTSSDSSPQSVRESDKPKVHTRQMSASPLPQLNSENTRRGTKTPRRGVREKNKETQTRSSPSIIPEEPEELPKEETTPKQALPFVFSPPSTRSRTRRKKSDTPDMSSIQEFAVPQGIGLLTPATSSSRSEKGATAEAASPHWENYINLISPFAAKESKPRRSSVASRTSTSSRHSMTLRTGPPKTRKIVKLK